MFWRNCELTGQLHMMFFTSYRFLTIVANFKQNDSCAEFFDATFNQLESSARCFTQAFPSEQYGPNWGKTTLAQSDLRPISSNSTVAHAALYKFCLKQQIKFLGYYKPHTPIYVNWQVRALFARSFRSNGQTILSGCCFLIVFDLRFMFSSCC